MQQISENAQKAGLELLTGPTELGALPLILNNGSESLEG